MFAKKISGPIPQGEPVERNEFTACDPSIFQSSVVNDHQDELPVTFLDSNLTDADKTQLGLIFKDAAREYFNFLVLRKGLEYAKSQAILVGNAGSTTVTLTSATQVIPASVGPTTVKVPLTDMSSTAAKKVSIAGLTTSTTLSPASGDLGIASVKFKE